ncbi:tyrosine-type recombinase/integrase [Burkholderia singularis]|uniref:tyrosine-type recombinase/integrase n=1 Tax=Burkholderia singularis TaxID=1503053 RepID=UPI001C3FFA8E|nr:tyrosine-type recombinase/integrase [Burkholderia singularis]
MDSSRSGKSAAADRVPLKAEALDTIRRRIGKHQTHVFMRSGEILTAWASVQWRAACKRAGITNFRFHGRRHTWTSWHIQNGTPLNRLMELGGWPSYEMVLRYAHLAERRCGHNSGTPCTPEMAGSEKKKAG